MEGFRKQGASVRHEHWRTSGKFRCGGGRGGRARSYAFCMIFGRNWFIYTILRFTWNNFYNYFFLAPIVRRKKSTFVQCSRLHLQISVLGDARFSHFCARLHRCTNSSAGSTPEAHFPHEFRTPLTAWHLDMCAQAHTCTAKSRLPDSKFLRIIKLFENVN